MRVSFMGDQVNLWPPTIGSHRLNETDQTQLTELCLVFEPQPQGQTSAWFWCEVS